MVGGPGMVGRWGKEGAAGMVLDGLVAEIERVKATIAAHRELLAGSEALTRYALIDPLLRALEWDTGDPGVVQPELRGVSGIADYALMEGIEPVALLEAKSLGGDLAKGIDQALRYCNTEGIAHMAVSDGSRWELYEVFRRARLEDRRITSFNIERDSNHAIALKALYLWRPNLSAQSITAPPEAVVRYTGAQEAGEANVANQESAQPRQTTQSQAPIAPPDSSNVRWVPLPEYWKREEKNQRPSRLRFPDGSQKTITTAKSAIPLVVQWLTAKQGLPEAPQVKQGNTYQEVDWVCDLLEKHGIAPATTYFGFDG